MKCLKCDCEIEIGQNFCRICGNSIEEAKTLPLPPKPNPNSPKSPDYTNEELPLQIALEDVLQTSLKFALVLGLSTIIIHFALTLIAPSSKNLVPVIKHEASIYFVQAVMAGLFAALTFTPIVIPLNRKSSWSSVAYRSFHQFLKGWCAIWISWCVLYLYISIILRLSPAYHIYNFVAQTTVDFLNACTSATFLYLFLVLDMPSVPTSSDPERNKDFRVSRRIVSGVSILIALFACLGRFNAYFEISVYSSGIFAAISMAYAFGRLDSHHMNVKRWTLAPLYFYSSIQVVGPKLVDFGENAPKPEYQDYFFAGVLLLKIYLFVIVTYWLQSGAFERYFNVASKYIDNDRSK